jgi:hypothetical protein
MARPKEKNAVRLQLSVDAKTYAWLDELAAAHGGSKSRVVDILTCDAHARLNSTAASSLPQTAAGVMAVAEFRERGQKRSTAVTIATKSRPSRGTQRPVVGVPKGKGHQP